MCIRDSIMTERYEVTTILQRLLSQNRQIFGVLTTGSKEKPAVTKISVHHFSKIVSGSPVLRPAWYFDIQQQGKGLLMLQRILLILFNGNVSRKRFLILPM